MLALENNPTMFAKFWECFIYKNEWRKTYFAGISWKTKSREREREKRLIDRGKDFIDVQKDRKNVC